MSGDAKGGVSMNLVEPVRSTRAAPWGGADGTAPLLLDEDLRAGMPCQPDTLFGRYDILELIGQGGFGTVFLAYDQVSRELVAIKRLRVASIDALAAIRRELCALAFLRIPGVVRLRDDGREGDAWYLVADFVSGPHAFSGAPLTWNQVYPVFVALLRTLVRVHAMGIVHRDLKPTNIRLDATGNPVILDFGLARGQVLARDRLGIIEGSRRYMSPEQQHGISSGALTDLFALGRVVREALTGNVEGTLPPDLPKEARGVIEAMTALDSRLRPSTATTVLDALDTRYAKEDVAHMLRHLPPDTPWDESTLARLFAGPEPFVHLPQDAAAALRHRTDGVPSRVAVEVVAWIRSGLVEVREDRIHVCRGAIAALNLENMQRSYLEAPREQHLGRARLEARRLDDEGRPSEAAAWLRQALAVARESGMEQAEELLLHELAELALASEVREEVEIALTEVRAAWWPAGSLDVLQAILEAGRALFAGERARALHLVESIPAAPTERLEIWRCGIRATASDCLPIADHRKFLENLRVWARTALRRAKLAGWFGNLRYREGRYIAAARAHERAARGKERIDEKLSAQYSVSRALLEAGRLQDARATALGVADEAARCRLARYEVLSTWVIRSVGYRLEEMDGPRVDLVDAAAWIGSKEEAMLALTEAAWAWRTGAHPLAASLANRAHVRFAGSGNINGAVVSAALAIAADPSAWEVHVPAVLREVERTAPGIAAQAYALLTIGAPYPDAGWIVLAREAARRGRFRSKRMRREVLSIAEAVAVDHD